MRKRNSNCQSLLLFPPSWSQWWSSICVSLAYLPRHHRPNDHHRLLRDQDPLNCTVRSCLLMTAVVTASTSPTLFFFSLASFRERTVVLSPLISLRRSRLENDDWSSLPVVVVATSIIITTTCRCCRVCSALWRFEVICEHQRLCSLEHLDTVTS